MSEGLKVGNIEEGASVNSLDGATDGKAVEEGSSDEGSSVGEFVSPKSVGHVVGLSEGSQVGACVGVSEGTLDGVTVGSLVGRLEGKEDGDAVGGLTDGFAVLGISVGLADGECDGALDSNSVGSTVGSVVDGLADVGISEGSFVWVGATEDGV